MVCVSAQCKAIFGQGTESVMGGDWVGAQAEGAVPHHGPSWRGECRGLAGFQGCPCQD